MTAPQPKIPIQGPAELAELLPFLTEFYPENAVVLHGVQRADGLHGPTMAANIVGGPDNWEEYAEAMVCEYLDRTVDDWAKPETAVIYISRTPAAGQDPFTVASDMDPLAKALISSCLFHDLKVLDVILISASRWWSGQCRKPGCCEGVPLPTEEAPGKLTVELIHQGFTRARRYDDIAADFTPRPAGEIPRQRGELEAESIRLGAMADQKGYEVVRDLTAEIVSAALADVRDGAADLPDEVAARLIIGLQDREARDQALIHAASDELPHARKLWMFLARRCVQPYTDLAAPILTLLAWTAWLQDDTPAARVALRRARDADPGHRLAEIFHHAMNTGADPGLLLDRIRQGLADSHVDPQQT